MFSKFVVFAACMIAVGLAWPYDRQFYDQPDGGYQRPNGGYGRPQNFGGYESENQHGYARPNGGYGRPSGGYGRPTGGYGRPTNVNYENSDNWQGASQGSGSQWQGQGEEQQPQQPHHQGGQFPPTNPSTFGDRFGTPTTGNNNFPPQVGVEPTNKVAEGVKTFGVSPPPVSPNAPLDPNIDLTGSRVFGGSSSDAAGSSSPDATESQGPSFEGSSSNNGDLTGLPTADAAQPSQESGSDNSESGNRPHPPLFGGAPAGVGSDSADSQQPSSSGNEPPVTIDPSATADSGLVLG